MSDGVVETTLAALTQCRAAYRAAINELHERNNDLTDWKPKVQALVDALTEISGNGYGIDAEPRAANIALEALGHWHGDQ
jgi:predicted phage tail protein